MSKISTLALLILTLFFSAEEQLPKEDQRKQAQTAMNEGNYKIAYDLYSKLVLDPACDPDKAGQDLTQAIQCLNNLNRSAEIDAFREKAVVVHGKNPWFLAQSAQTCLSDIHFGYIVAGEFYRGYHDGGGEYASSQERDRVRALQLMVQAMERMGAQDPHRLAQFYIQFSHTVMWSRQGGQEWRLGSLTDLAQLPDYDIGYYYYYGSSVGAPVDEEGNPIFYRAPLAFATAKNDGERWRWLLDEAKKLSPARGSEIRMQLANFLHQQFGVQTMSYYSWFFSRQADEKEGGTYALHALKENETIARLASGIKRFTLPEEFDFIRIFREVAEESRSGYAESAWNSLAGIFENRRQYDKAAECWLESIERYKDSGYKRDRRDQIVKNWGTFEPARSQADGEGAVVDYRFRNGSKVSFEAHEIDQRKLLNDIKAYLKSNPGTLNWEKLNPGQIGHRLVEKKEERYLKGKTASWDLELKPRSRHFDRRITVTTPLQKAGAYLVTARMEGGNTSRIILWVQDSVIVKRALDEGTHLYVADARTGAPVSKANVEFFGYRQERVKSKLKAIIRKYEVLTSNFAEFTGEDGQLIVKSGRVDNNFNWLIIATTPEGRLAYLGFTNMWHSNYYHQEYNQYKTFAITDRPVYRPGQTVKFKCWLRQAQYDQEDVSQYANQSFVLKIHDPKGDKILEKSYTTDAYGGFDGELILGSDAALGVYNLHSTWGGATFRVEEYKKPEFEVKVEAPDEPVALGDTITATIRADYYFGAPVTEATVKYKVLRSPHTARWYPIGIWDWFYGPGYWWFACDYEWYPGWYNWGLRAPRVWWQPWNPEPPEVVMENEVEIGHDGTVEIKIDTSVAKEIHGNQDHSYRIEVEVRDASRRTIMGSGEVLAARKPFQVYAWVDRGYYSVDDDIHAHFSASTLDRKPVKGKGEATLFKITYDEKKNPKETAVQTWKVDTDDEGRADLKIKASKAGQYRLSYRLTDGQGRAMEGGYMFLVRGEGFDGSQFRFNHIELITDQREYAPGGKVKLMVNTDRADGTVLLFLRPSNGVYMAPKMLRMKGKSTLFEINVTKKDMPNFFIEAMSISDGAIHTQTKEIIVPPEKKVLNVEVMPSSTTYKPGEKAKVRLFVKDLLGKPFQGSAALTIYDRAVEYISGGSNVPEIRSFFWKWRRRHYVSQQSNLNSYQGYGQIFTTPAMQNLGVFGHLTADMDFADEEGERSGYELGKGKRQRAMKNEVAMDGAFRAKEAAPSAPAESMGLEEKDDSGMAGEKGPDLVQPMIRTKFADTAYWAASIETDADGFAEIELTMPENLTSWKIKTWVMGHGTRVGEASVEVQTKKNLLLRMQAPRFFVEKDEVVLSANVHNYLDSAKDIEALLELDGENLELMGGAAQSINVAANGEQRVDWRVKVIREGEAVIRMKALSDEESDAMEMRFPVYVHGMSKTESFSGAIRPDGERATITFNVPEERRINESRLEIRYSPTLAAAMVDALPYLAEYPYGCTEQTLNRFLPSVITQKILLDMGLDLKSIRDKRVNFNAQEIGDSGERAERWKYFKRNPVFDEALLKDMVKTGLARLTNMQLSDGGWGWFSGWGEQSYPHTTAVVVHGFQVARENDLALVPGILERGIQWLEQYQKSQVTRIKNAAKKIRPWKSHADNLDAFIFMVLSDEKKVNEEMRDFLYRDRKSLSVYAKAMFGMALHKQGQTEKLDMIVENIEQFLVMDEENQTAWLNLPGSYWWYWYGSEYEAHAYYLKLLALTDPKSEKASGLAKYLINNRRHGTYWNSTRDTALCIEALADYMRASGEDRPELTLEIFIDGRKHKEVDINGENLFHFDSSLLLLGDAVESGEHVIELRKKGKGPLYFNAYLTYFSLEDYITKAGLEIKVNRAYYKLVKKEKHIDVAGSRGQAVSQKVEKYERQPIENLATLKSGDLVEIELTIDSKNDYEYIIFEDMKAAGFEPVEVQSGYLRSGMHAYMELRDEKVGFFVRFLAQGKHSLSYRMRAEIPGFFSALPTRAYAMYAPELKGNSDEIKLNIDE